MTTCPGAKERASSAADPRQLAARKLEKLSQHTVFATLRDPTFVSGLPPHDQSAIGHILLTWKEIQDQLSDSQR